MDGNAAYPEAPNLEISLAGEVRWYTRKLNSLSNSASQVGRTLRAAVKKIALDDEKYRPYFINEAIIISIQTQDSICVNLGLYMIKKIIGFYWELVVSVFIDPIVLTESPQNEKCLKTDQLRSVEADFWAQISSQ